MGFDIRLILKPMSTSRTDALQAMLAQDPNNQLARYGLAMELANSGQREAADAEYRRLLEVNPQYAAAYYHGGQNLEKMGQTDEARVMYEKGIEVTTQSGDAHTRAELEAALLLL